MNKAKAMNLALTWFNQNFGEKDGKDFALPLTVHCVNNTWLFAALVTSNDWDTERTVCVQLQYTKIVKITASEFGVLLASKKANKIPSAVAYLAQFGVVAKQRWQSPNAKYLTSGNDAFVIEKLKARLGAPRRRTVSGDTIQVFQVPDCGSIEVIADANKDTFVITLYNGASFRLT